MDCSSDTKTGQQGRSRNVGLKTTVGLSGSSQNNEKFEPYDAETAPMEQEDYFIPLNNLPQAQAVFSIPKIREKIFSYISRSELIQLRLVSQDFRRYENEALLNAKENVIRIGKMLVCKQLNQTINRCDKFEEPVVDLTKLMDATGLYPFPCSQYEIILSNWKDEGDEIQLFLACHGWRIKKLKLQLQYQGRCNRNSFDEICLHEEKWVAQILTKLLLSQGLNVVELEVDFDKRRSKKNLCEKSLAKVTINRPPGVFNTKLRSVSMSSNLPPSVFEMVCQMAPNLKDFNTGNLNCYIEPVSRLHFLKDLWFGFMMGEEMDELTKKIASTDGQLHLTKLTINFPCMTALPEDFPEKAEIINKILEKSAQSLKMLKMTASESLPIKFPLMKKLDTISLYRTSSFEGPRPFFPAGMRLGDTFPNLTTLCCYPCKYFLGGYLTDEFFVISSEKQILASVREIRLRENHKISENTQQWFPNAKFTFLSTGSLE